MNKKKMIEEAKGIRRSEGGTIFAFPVNMNEPFSKYAVVVYAGNRWHVYPETNSIHEAAIGVKTILEQFVINGYGVSYEKDVRFLIGENQLNAPDVTTRRLRNDMKNFTV